ncbi:MAG TPA: flagellar biosynthetic protein FliR [Planctomycetota bacterium]|nr:flagellar biosynthetic protein FliR [Planctomycetota bacterium]
MEKIFELGRAEAPFFALTFFRASGLVLPAPVLGSASLPAPLKAFLALALAAVFFPWVGRPAAPPSGMAAFFLAAAGEFAVGAFVGFSAWILFAAVRSAGRLLDQELGISAASLLDPLTPESSSVLAGFKVLLAAVLYLLIDGHHLLIAALADSFRAVPLPAAGPSETTLLQAARSLPADLFRMAVQIAAPAWTAAFLVTIAAAFAARAVPDLNAFALSFALRLLVGVLVLAAGVGLFAENFRALHEAHFGAVRGLVARWGG